MANSELTPAQRQILETLPESIDSGRLDRIWIFDPQTSGTRETGLFVVSLHSESRPLGEMRELLTVRYIQEQAAPQPRLDTQILPEGWAPPNRIDRVIAGVLARSGDTATEPREEAREPTESWEMLMLRLDPSG